jgi:hypothetical protein
MRGREIHLDHPAIEVIAGWPEFKAVFCLHSPSKRAKRGRSFVPRRFAASNLR